MPLEIKKLSTVDVAETLTDDAKLLVEDNGTVKRAPKSMFDGTILDAGGYYTSGTVEGALQEIGAELFGLRELIGGGF